MGAFDGLRVIDLTQNLAGPICAMNLGDHGADVVKIEPAGGDTTRTTAPRAGGESVAFMIVNRNKRSIVLNLKEADDRDVLLNLLEGADILLESGKPGGMAKMGLDWASLKVRFPRLIYGSVSGFGQTGPYSSRGGFDIMAQALSGLMSVNGPIDGPPHRLPIPICDISTGLHFTIGILAALEARHRTGQGQYVETSLLDVSASLQIYEAAYYFTHGASPPRMGQAHRGISPYQIFPCEDGHIAIAAGSQHLYVKFCELAQTPELIDDPRFSRQLDRVEHNDALIAILSRSTVRHSTEWWEKNLSERGIPCGTVLTHEQVFQHPQILHRQMVETVDHPSAGATQTLGIPVKLSDTQGNIRRPAPLLGQHSDEIRAAIAAGEIW